MQENNNQKDVPEIKYPKMKTKVKISEDLHELLKEYCEDTGQEMSGVMERIIRNRMEEK